MEQANRVLTKEEVDIIKKHYKKEYELRLSKMDIPIMYRDDEVVRGHMDILLKK